MVGFCIWNMVPTKWVQNCCWQPWHQASIKKKCFLLFFFFLPSDNYINARMITVYNSFPYKCLSPAEQSGVTHTTCKPNHIFPKFNHRTYFNFKFKNYTNRKIKSQQVWCVSRNLNIYSVQGCQLISSSVHFSCTHTCACTHTYTLNVWLKMQGTSSTDVQKAQEC